MAIKIRIAKSAKELNDVYRLRHSVYQADGSFQNTAHDYIIDLYDSVPNCINIIAYSEETAVGTMRVTVENEIGTAADESFDFTPYKNKIRQQALDENTTPPVFASSGMLAIAEEWRNRRDVFRALLRMAVDVGHSLNVSHIIATVNAKTIGIYKRLGWEILSDEIWIEEIGSHIIAVATPLVNMYNWAFNMLAEQKTLLDHFSGCFRWYLLDGATTIFEQDSYGDKAYLITKGGVDIACRYKENAELLSLAKLGPGDMFGELSLIDEAPRSASATTIGNTELLVIDRETFWQKIQENATYLRDLMEILSKRLRSADERALLYAHATLEERMVYFTKNLRQNAVIDPKNPNQRIAKVSTTDFASMALATPEEAETHLAKLEAQNLIKRSKHTITFIEKD